MSRFKKRKEQKWLIFGIFFAIIAIVLFIGSFTFLKDIKKTDYAKSSENGVYLSFSKNYCEVGKPLTVTLNGADNHNVTYSWTVGGSKTDNTTDTYTPVEEDLEKFINVSVTYEKNKTVTASLYCSKLPVVYINSSGFIGDSYVTGTMSMQGNSIYTSDNTTMYNGGLYIKLRGNSTKDRAKAPYKIKLEKDCDLFNLGKSKHWILLANDIDHTFIRNKLTYDFSSDIGADYAAESLNVVLILNNSYNGVYQLCEQLRVSDERIDIYDWDGLAKEAATLITNVKKETEGLSNKSAKEFNSNLEAALKTDYKWISSPYTFKFEDVEYNISDYVDIPEITGGFLLEMDFYHNNDPNGVQTKFKQPFYFNAPEYGFTNSDLRSYASKYIQSFEYALHSPDFTYHNNDTHYSGNGYFFDWDKGWISEEKPTIYSDPENDGKHYSELFDMNSLLVNYFVCEFSMNWDSMKNSTFVTKDLDGPALLSPAWDYDWAYGNNNMYNIDTYFPTDWHTTNDYFTNEQYYQSVQWNRFLVKDPYFLFLAYNKYKEIRPTVIEDIIKEGGLLDKYYDELKEAGMANDAKWSYTYRDYHGESFEDSMNSLRTFIETRVNWMDEQFKNFETYISSVGYYKPSDELSIVSVIDNNDGTTTITGQFNGNDSSDLVFLINGTTLLSCYGGTDGIGNVTVDSSVFGEDGTNIIQILIKDKNGKYVSDCSNFMIY